MDSKRIAHEGRAARKPATPRLWLHLSIALAVKFAVLGYIWHEFVRPERRTVDAASMQDRLAPVSAPLPTPEGQR